MACAFVRAWILHAVFIRVISLQRALVVADKFSLSRPLVSLFLFLSFTCFMYFRFPLPFFIFSVARASVIHGVPSPRASNDNLFHFSLSQFHPTVVPVDLLFTDQLSAVVCPLEL